MPAMPPPVIPSDCSVTTVGNRVNRYSCDLKQTTLLVLDDLLEDSRFFEQNLSRLVPRFETSEVICGAELGTGEFGVVLEVSAFSMRDAPPIMDSALSGNEEVAAPLLLEDNRDRREHFSPPRSIFVKKFSSQETVSKNNETTADVADTPAAAILPDPNRIEAQVVCDENTRTANKSPTAGTTDHSEHVSASVDDEDMTESLDQSDSHSSPDVDATNDEKLAILQARYAKKIVRDGVARFALKRIKDNITDPSVRLNATLDLACEARYLKSISHSNVIRLRATVGEPGTLSFGIMLDRLITTLDKRITQWQKEHNQRHHGLAPLLSLCNRMEWESGEKALYADRLLVAFDLARAMAHLHRLRIIYRDVKPENMGFNVRGDVQIFDFGLAKELKAKDLVEGTDGYDATGLTGSRRYMAPEVVRCLPYGFSSDVYSFFILFWQLFSLKTPFESLDANQHYDKIIECQKRPYSLRNLPKILHKMMENGWSDDPKQRPSMKQVCQILQQEIVNVGGGDALNRTSHLLDSSLRSFATRTGAA